jgi:mitogen-activated protein kinase kinase kinase
VSQTARVGSHLRQNPSIDGLTMGTLPASQPVIRVIYTGGMTKVLNVKNCRSADEIITFVLKKLGLPENQHRNYCFYVLDGLEPNPQMTRRVSDGELMRICNGGKERSERNRLILRKIHAGDPDPDELRRASQIAYEESQIAHTNAISSNSQKSQAKLQKLTGESWDSVKYPMSPAPFLPTDRNRSQTASTIEDRDSERRRSTLDDRESELQDYDRPESAGSRRGGSQKLRQFFGGRPPSEMIIHELTTYFPSHQKEEIEKTVRMSVRRSQRMSRAASHLSVVSNASYASSLKDAPPIPSIADAWLSGVSGIGPTRASRPLSVSKFGSLPQTAFRDSIASSSLQPLAEESPLEPNRKSYVSFDSGSDTNLPGQDSDNRSSFFDTDTQSTATHSESLNSHLSQIITADGDEADEPLNQFLSGNAWDNVSWMRGALIGQGSFGSVYLALHAVTGELMAVKQVELPSVQKDTEIDRKKQTMITALKHEINLLRDLQHPNIVQYLGTAADDHHLNIFLEYVPGGSIAAMLKQYNTFQEPLIRNFVRQILDGLSYLHGRDIIHRDIKGANVLVDNKGGIKISDFGISKRVEASSMLGSQSHMNRPSLQGSVYWMAPEVVRQTAHTKKADIWSLGCLVVEMFSGSHPFPNCSQLQAIFAIGSNQAKPTVPEGCSEEAKGFLERTFEIDHERRPSADELLTSGFLVPIA